MCSFFLVETPSSLPNVAPRTIGARAFIHHIGLKFNRRPKFKLGGREFLLKGLVRSSDNVNSVLSKKTCERFRNTTDIRKADHGGAFIFNQTEEMPINSLSLKTLGMTAAG